jgi:hypothetical protein
MAPRRSSWIQSVGNGDSSAARVRVRLGGKTARAVSLRGTEAPPQLKATQQSDAQDVVSHLAHGLPEIRARSPASASTFRWFRAGCQRPMAQSSFFGAC